MFPFVLFFLSYLPSRVCCLLLAVLGSGVSAVTASGALLSCRSSSCSLALPSCFFSLFFLTGFVLLFAAAGWWPAVASSLPASSSLCFRRFVILGPSCIFLLSLQSTKLWYDDCFDMDMVVIQLFDSLLVFQARGAFYLRNPEFMCGA